MLDNSDMFESTACFDASSIITQQMLNLDYHHHNHQEFSNFNNNNQLPNFPQSDHFTIENQQQQQQQINWTTTNNHDNNNCMTSQTPPPDLLNLFQLPKCSSSISFSNPAHIDQVSVQVMYDPLLPLNNLLPQPPFFGELINSIPNGFNLTGCGSIFGEMDMERGDHEQMYHDGDAVLEFGGGIITGKDRDTVSNKVTKHFATEKHRRQQLNGKYVALKNLVPNPTKTDRASVVGDAIEYINELKRTVEELKILVDRKRCNRGRMKKQKTEDDSTLEVESIYMMSNGVGGCGGGGDMGHDQQAYNGNSTSTMRTSWLQRKSKNTEIDVRIIDDEVTIKLVQQKRINCLLLISKVLGELQLELHHVAGGLIGDFYSYLFNTKICEGSSVYASAIANKLIEVVDKQYANIPVTSSY